MCDIKNKFIERAIESIDEERMSDEEKLRIAEFRWDCFVANFLNQEYILKYIEGNDW